MSYREERGFGQCTTVEDGRIGEWFLVSLDDKVLVWSVRDRLHGDTF